MPNPENKPKLNRRVREAVPELLRGRNLSTRERAVAAMMRSGLVEPEMIETLAMTPTEIGECVTSIIAKAKRIADDRSRRIQLHNSKGSRRHA